MQNHLLFLVLTASVRLFGQSPVPISRNTIEQTIANTIQGDLNDGTSVLLENSNSSSGLVLKCGVTEVWVDSCRLYYSKEQGFLFFRGFYYPLERWKNFGFEEDDC